MRYTDRSENLVFVRLEGSGYIHTVYHKRTSIKSSIITGLLRVEYLQQKNFLQPALQIQARKQSAYTHSPALDMLSSDGRAIF